MGEREPFSVFAENLREYPTGVLYICIVHGRSRLNRMAIPTSEYPPRFCFSRIGVTNPSPIRASMIETAFLFCTEQHRVRSVLLAPKSRYQDDPGTERISSVEVHQLYVGRMKSVSGADALLRKKELSLVLEEVRHCVPWKRK
jgi:hypothetical protein